MCASTLFYFLDGHTIVLEKYKKFRNLNGLVATRTKGCCKITCISLQMIFKMLWINFLQWANNTVQIHHKGSTVLSYVLHGNLYKILIKHKKGPKPVLMVLDHDGEDVTQEVIPYMGTDGAWHGVTYQPSFWGKKMLIFEMASGEQKKFGEHEPITIDYN